MGFVMLFGPKRGSKMTHFWGHFWTPFLTPFLTPFSGVIHAGARKVPIFLIVLERFWPEGVKIGVPGPVPGPGWLAQPASLAGWALIYRLYTRAGWASQPASPLYTVLGQLGQPASPFSTVLYIRGQPASPLYTVRASQPAPSVQYCI